MKHFLQTPPRSPWLFSALLALSVLWLAAAPGVAQTRRTRRERDTSPRSTILGVVTDTASKPVAGAAVQIQESSGKTPRAKKTDAQGKFRFERVRKGLYDVRATFQGRSSEWMRNIVVKPGTEITVTVVIPDKPSEK